MLWSKRASLLIALALIGLFAVGIGLGTGVVAQRIDTTFNAQVALGCITFFGTTWLALWQFRRTKQKEAEARIFSQRATVYQRLVNALRDMFYSQRGWIPEISLQDRARILSEITYEMTIWGGQDTVRALLNMTQPVDVGDAAAMMLRISDLFKAIRKDLGHKDDAALPDDLLLQLIRVDDQEEVRQQLAAARAAKLSRVIT